MKSRFQLLDDQSYPQIFQFIETNLSQNQHDTIIEEENFMKMFDYLDIKNHLSFQLITENATSHNIVGVVLGGKRGNDAYISLILVKKELQNQGYGRVLLEKALSLMSQQECHCVSLEVVSDNLPAINLYSSEGFNITAEIMRLKNDHNSFYIHSIDQQYEVMKMDDYPFQPLYRSFLHKKNISWIQQFRTLFILLNHYNAELLFIKESDKIIGYMVLLRQNNILNIYDIALKKENPELLQYFLSQALEGETMVVIKTIGEDDWMYFSLIQAGFYVTKRQLYMERLLSTESNK
ncbi:MAG: GNAT family N-acetyltransferase [Spirochaetes bacterium]|nr:GNAT family N-acetyltransferase [Spirochaetota bacterium]